MPRTESLKSLHTTLIDAEAGYDEALKDAEAPDEVRLALDVAREAIRSGVPEVHMYCLESLDEIPAAREEIEEAEKEGIHLHTRYGPRRIIGRDGKVTGIELVRASRVFDENRRFGAAAAEVADHLLIVGRTNRRALLAGVASVTEAPAQVLLVDRRDRAVEWVRRHLGPGDAVLYENDLPDHYP